MKQLDKVLKIKDKYQRSVKLIEAHILTLKKKKKKNSLYRDVEALDKRIIYFLQLENDLEPVGAQSVSQLFNTRRKIAIVKKHIIQYQSERILLKGRIEEIQKDIDEANASKRKLLHKESKICKRIGLIKRNNFAKQLILDELSQEDMKYGIR